MRHLKTIRVNNATLSIKAYMSIQGWSNSLFILFQKFSDMEVGIQGWLATFFFPRLTRKASSSLWCLRCGGKGETAVIDGVIPQPEGIHIFRDIQTLKHFYLNIFCWRYRQEWSWWGGCMCHLNCGHTLLNRFAGPELPTTSSLDSVEILDMEGLEVKERLPIL